MLPTPERDSAPTFAASITPLPTRTPVNVQAVRVSPTLACEDAPRTRLIIGERGRVLDDDEEPLNVRPQPGTNEGNDPIGILQVLDIFEVLDGPRCAGQYAWYYVRSEVHWKGGLRRVTLIFITSNPIYPASVG